jgi:hypothetical protein
VCSAVKDWTSSLIVTFISEKSEDKGEHGPEEDVASVQMTTIRLVIVGTSARERVGSPLGVH